MYGGELKNTSSWVSGKIERTTWANLSLCSKKERLQKVRNVGNND